MDKAIALAIAVFFAGCATTGLEAIKRGDTVSIVHQPRIGQAGTVGVRDQVLVTHAGGGALGGMVAGGALGVACGPFFAVCMPATILLGGAVGAAGGAVVGYARGIPVEQHRELADRMAAFTSAHDLGADLAAVIGETAAPYWSVTSAAPDVSIAVRYEEAALRTGSDDAVRLYVRATVTVRRHGKGDGNAKSFEYLGLPSGVRPWIEDPGFVGESFLHAHRNIANTLVNELVR